MRESKDIVVKPTKIIKKVYKSFFIPFKYGNHIFPAIDPFFEGLLKKEKNPSETTLREFSINPKDYPSSPMVFYTSLLGESPIMLVLSAGEIIRYFLQNQENLAKRNFFLLNAEPSAIDIRIVDIRFLRKVRGKKRYFLYCYLYNQWEILGRSSIKETVKFFAPIRE